MISVIRDDDGYLLRMPDGRLTPIVLWALPRDGKAEVRIIARDPDNRKGESVISLKTREPGLVALAEQREAVARDWARTRRHSRPAGDETTEGQG